MTAATKGNLKMLDLMLRNKSLDIDVSDSNSGVNAFWLACLYGHGNIMKILAEAGTEIYNTNHRKVNVLHLAILKNHVQIVNMLIQSGFSLSEETSDGSTALHLVALTNHRQIGELILTHLTECGFKQSHMVELISKPNP
jgi:ankyrin repeat protein